MLSSQIMELESENRQLRELLQRLNEDISKPKDCGHCRHYVQHYARNGYNDFHIVYMGHCTCGVPINKRKGKKYPAPDDTCMCFEERG